MPSTTISSSANEWAIAERELAQEQQLQEKVINEEFKIWKKTVPLLYDFIHTFALNYPSTVFQWLPTYNKIDDDNVEVKFVHSNNSINKIENSLNVASITLPSSIIQSIDLTIPSDGINTSNFNIINKWKQTTEVNTLKLSPDGNSILSFNRDGIIHSYNFDNDNVLDYKYHKQNGHALNWIDNDRFLSGSNDSQIALWQRNKPSTPIQLFKTHYGAINDLSSSDLNIFGSVSDDSTTQFFDLRSSNDINPIIKIENKFIQNCIKFHPNVKNFYATGGKDNVINLYDLRNYKTPFRKLFGHNDSIKQIEWDWSNPSILVSSGFDSRIIFWNLDNLDEDFTYPDTSANNTSINSQTSNLTESTRRRNQQQQVNKVDPCLKYIHGGHVSSINDFAIHPKLKNLFASVGDDKLLEIWKPKTLNTENEGEDDEDDEQQEEVEVGETKVDEKVDEDDDDEEKEEEVEEEDDIEEDKDEEVEEDGQAQEEDVNLDEEVGTETKEDDDKVEEVAKDVVEEPKDEDVEMEERKVDTDANSVEKEDIGDETRPETVETSKKDIEMKEDW
ncbi:hypothetical protein KGF54_005420 [Candida jiufengensis]|uniref:uncharacterized protein n=1 Tax=Candida jiufengensis TaxID=497108 RepID=UPI0022252F98|nr:uncharacterized protein KGF54_005420 [Candida jiufengensis]KAI5949543.1 hypothetical protein KGF54_005420 [Candida jiufengensis]